MTLKKVKFEEFLSYTAQNKSDYYPWLNLSKSSTTLNNYRFVLEAFEGKEGLESLPVISRKLFLEYGVKYFGLEPEIPFPEQFDESTHFSEVVLEIGDRYSDSDFYLKYENYEKWLISPRDGKKSAKYKVSAGQLYQCCEEFAKQLKQDKTTGLTITIILRYLLAEYTVKVLGVDPY